MARIGERVEADPAQVPGLAGGDVAVEVGDNALRQVVGLDLAGHRQRLQLRHQPPVAADDAANEPAVRQMVEPAFLAVALACRINQTEAARLADATLLGAVEKALFQRDGDRLCKADADEAAGRDRVARADQAHRLARGRDLPVGLAGRRAKAGDSGAEHGSPL